MNNTIDTSRNSITQDFIPKKSSHQFNGRETMVRYSIEHIHTKKNSLISRDTIKYTHTHTFCLSASFPLSLSLSLSHIHTQTAKIEMDTKL